MNFSYYIHFFHDGSLNIVRHNGDWAKFELNSACLVPGENKENILLDRHNRIRGSLILNGIKSIQINNNPFHGHLEMNSLDSAEVLDFDVIGNLVRLGIGWNYYIPKPADLSYTLFEIEADEIIWEDELNPITLDLTNLDTTKPPDLGD